MSVSVLSKSVGERPPIDEGAASTLRLRTDLRCFQYHPSIMWSDAIGNSIRALDRMLRLHGMKSVMLCADSQVGQSSGGVRPLSSVVELAWRPSDLLVVHYSFYDDHLARILALPVRKIIVYHNITPSHFFRHAGMEPFANLSDMALTQISKAHDVFEAVVGDSNYNLSQMSDIGCSTRVAIPVFYEESAFSDPLADYGMYFDLKQRQDINLLFVGRFVPNKRHDKLVEIVAELKKLSSRKISLHLVGKIWGSSYYLELLSKAASLNVLDQVRIYQDAPQTVVRTLFAAADAFVSMSEHEGFMVPLLEAFAAGCPVVADPTTAVKETMGEAGLKIEHGQPSMAAGMIEMLTRDKQLRLEVVAGQAARVLEFRSAVTFRKWIDLLRQFEAIEDIAT